MSENKLATCAAILFFAVGIILYWPGLNGPFLFDDYTNTTQLHLDSLKPGALADLALSSDSGVLRRPVSILSLGLNKYFSGLDPFAYKLTNVAIHLSCALALLIFAISILRVHGINPATRHAFFIALASTLIWLLHPLQVSTVLYVVQRMAQLSALFSVLALSSFVLARIAINNNRRNRFLIHALACLLFTLLAILSKENGVLIPLYMALIEWLFFGARTTPERLRTWRRGFLALFVALPLVTGFAYLITHINNTVSAGYALRTFTAGERLLTEAQAMWFYLKLIFLPQLHDMSLYHDDFMIVRHLDMLTILAISGIVLLLGLAIAIRRKAPLITFGILWFFIGHLLESTVFPLELIFEHRNYLAMFGPLLTLSYYAVPALMRLKKPLLATTTVLGIGGCLLFFLTFMRVDTWSSKEKLFVTTNITHPNSSRTKMELANLYLLRKDFNNAERQIKGAMELSPWNTGLPVTLLIAGCQKGEISKTLYDSVADRIHQADKPGLLYSSMLFLEKQFFSGHCSSLTIEQLLKLTEIIIYNKKLIPGPRQRFTANFLHARVLARSGQFAAARSAYLAAYRAKPGELGPLFELAYLQLNNDFIDEASQTAILVEQADERRLLRHQTAEIEELKNFIQQASRQEAGQHRSNS